MLDPDTVCSIVRQGRVDGALLLIPSYADVKDRGAPRPSHSRRPGHGGTGLVQVLSSRSRLMILEWDLLASAVRYLARLQTAGVYDFRPGLGVHQKCAHKGYFSWCRCVFPKATPIKLLRVNMQPRDAAENTTWNWPAAVRRRPDWQQVMMEFAVNTGPMAFLCPAISIWSRAYKLLRQHGIEPERDITTVSCDNAESYLSLLDIRPATIDLCSKELGVMCGGFTACHESRIRMRPITRTLITPRLVLPA